MNKYRTYVSEIPKKLRKLNKEAYFVKPVGGLWGCKGNEWKEFCTKYNPEHDPEKYNMNNLNKCFEWTLADDAKIYTIDKKEDFAFLVENYFKPLKNQYFNDPRYNYLGEINYYELSKKYDGVSITKRAFKNMGKGFYPYNKMERACSKELLYAIGLAYWSVPSICVFNSKKVKILGEVQL